MQTPFLQGKTIYLRGLRRQDLDGPWLSWFDDAEVCRYNNHWRFPNSRDRMQSYLEHVQGSQRDLVLAIVSQANDTHIGNVSLQNIDWISRSAEFAIIIGDRSHWNKGVAYEAGSLIVKHGLEELNLHRIYCGTSADNLGMQKLALKLGMREEGRRREAMFKHGRYVDVVEFGLIRKP